MTVKKRASITIHTTVRTAIICLLAALSTACHDSSSSDSGSAPVPGGGNENGNGGAGPSASELGPLVSGETSYVDGVFVWTDYAYDDRGSNSNSLPGGDAAYLDPPHTGNTADLIQLQLTTAGDGALRITAILQTLVEAHNVLLGLGLDTDNDSSTGAESLPGGQWSNDTPLGLEQLVLFNSNGGGRLLAFIGEDWVETATFAVEVDREDNMLSAGVAALRPGSDTWNAVAALGPADDNAGWFDGSDAIFDLAFVRGEDPITDPALALQEQVPQIQRPWQDKHQADILAGAAPAADAVAAVQFGTTMTQLPNETTPGLHTFLYRSPLTLQEGVSPDPLQYRGIYQPYVVMIREGLPAQPPAVMFMHGADQNHLVNTVHFSNEGLAIDGFYDVPAVVIFPMGRDPNWGTGLSEQDLLDVTDDAIERLNLDANRIVLSGISAGGIGTFRHAARYPDRWTGGYSIVGGGTKNLGNLRNLPLRGHNGALDPLVNVSFWQASADALAATEGVNYRTVLVHTTSHLPSPLGNCWYLEMLAKDRQINPARVTYTTDPGDYFVDEAQNLNLRPRRAYWVLELIARDENPAAIDATSLARGDRNYTATDIDQFGSSLTGADFCGPNPDSVGTDTWEELGRAQTLAEPAPTENAMALSLSSLASATLDVQRMSLDTSQALRIDSNSDGATLLRLIGDWPQTVSILEDGAPGPAPAIDATGLSFTVSAGEHVYTLD